MLRQSKAVIGQLYCCSAFLHFCTIECSRLPTFIVITVSKTLTSTATYTRPLGPNTIAQTKERLFFLDLLKAISIVSVVSFHATFIPIANYAAYEPPLEILFSPLKFCVPTLLTISFFLLTRSAQSNSRSKGMLVKKRLTRLAVPTLFWFSIGTGIQLAQGHSLHETLHQVLIGEAFTGAYYLLIVLQLIPVAIYLQGRWTRSNAIAALIVGLQMLVFVVVYSLAGEPERLESVRSLSRTPFFYWLAYVALGAWVYHKSNALSRLSFRLSPLAKAGLLGCLALCFMLESVHLMQLFDNRLTPFEYMTLSCLLSGPLMLLCCINIKPAHLPKWLRQSVLTLSQYSLGIFCLNGILFRVFRLMGSHYLGEYTFTFTETLLVKLASWAVLLLISLAGSIILSKVGLKNVVC